MSSAEPNGRGSGVHATLGADRGPFRLEASLDLAAGSVTALIGPNGAGKSTVVAALAGLVPLRSGRVVVDGVVVDEVDTGVHVPAGSRGVATCFQSGLLFPGISVLDNVAFGMRAAGVARREARTRAKALLEQLGLAERAADRPGALSGGQAARVGLARALAVQPRLLLLDEPMAAVDAVAREELRYWLAEVLAATDVTTLLVTHDPADAQALAQTVVVLEQGRVTERLPAGALARGASDYATRFGA